MTTTPVASTLANTILIHEVDGRAVHCFCTEDHAKEVLRKAPDMTSGGSMFSSEDTAAELVYSVSPDLRNRVEAAKSKLAVDLAIRDALNRNGVPQDPTLRTGIYKAITELRQSHSFF